MGQGVHVLSGLRLIPRTGSILARTSAIIVVSSLVVAATALVSLNLLALVPLTKQSAADKADLITMTAKMWAEIPSSKRRAAYVHDAYVIHELNLAEEQSDLPELTSRHYYYDLLKKEIEKIVGSPVVIKQDDSNILWVDIPFESGDSLQVGFMPDLPHGQQVFVGLSLIAVLVAIMLIIAFLVVRRISRPLTEVAEAASTFRGIGGFTPLPETGMDEFVLLARSFNTMAAEIETLIANRTTLSAGISHDLRTPLTRMTLALELLPDDVDPKLVQRFRSNLASMDALITDAAYFARGEPEKATKADAVRLIRGIVQSIDESTEITWSTQPTKRVPLATSALERCLRNLVENAQRHAKAVRVHVSASQDALEIHVLDDGPGIPEQDRLRVLQPFVRLEESRNTKTGGSGLGLAIVAQLCQIQGWGIELGDSPSGGTDAKLLIPLNKRESQKARR
ncbi:MAG: ATP-binding protein [Gammaproteobacteria bacterium]|nr:ATP-binding protein [Gammaproteobacteria bacterium]